MKALYKKIVGVTSTDLRDAFQSRWANRHPTWHLIPLFESGVLDKVGYNSIEVWGGATPQACILFLGENQFDRIRTFKKYVRNTPSQMLLRGINLVAFRHFGIDVVEKFIKHSATCYNGKGIDIFRIFDALNDIKNLELPIQIVNKVGAHAQGTICYTISPVHTIEKYIEFAEQLVERGVGSLCIKDMAGILSPGAAYELVKGLRKKFGEHLPIWIHTHCSSGAAPAAILAAIDAGADGFDGAVTPLSWFSSQPPIGSMDFQLDSKGIYTGINKEAIIEIGKFFEILVKQEYYKLFEAELQIVDDYVVKYQIPGGMISNFIAQLSAMGKLYLLDEVCANIPKVREDMGWPPLVTPASQIVGTAALYYTLHGGWEGMVKAGVVSKEIKDYFAGKYGRFPAQPNPEVQKLILKHANIELVKDYDPACLPNELEDVKKQLEKEGLPSENKDCLLSVALFGHQALPYWKGVMEGKAELKTGMVHGDPKAGVVIEIFEKDKIKKAYDVLKENRFKVPEEVGKLSFETVQMLVTEYSNRNIRESFGPQVGPAIRLLVQHFEKKEGKSVVLTKEPMVEGIQKEKGIQKGKEDLALGENEEVVKSPMGGTVAGINTNVGVGKEIKEDDVVLVIEAMKMQNEIKAGVRGKILKILVKQGDIVSEGGELVIIEKRVEK